MEAIDLSNLKVFRGKLVDYRRKSCTANGSVMFNDMLGTTQGTFSDGKYSKNNVTLFGETDNKETMFTGKPQIDGIGYAFLFRSYRPELAKWQTSDPLGYPDGFNNFAYCNNGVTKNIDYLGCSIFYPYVNEDGSAGTGSYYSNNTSSELYTSPWGDSLYYKSNPIYLKLGPHTSSYGVDVEAGKTVELSYTVGTELSITGSVGGKIGYTPPGVTGGPNGSINASVATSLSLNLSATLKLSIPSGTIKGKEGYKIVAWGWQEYRKIIIYDNIDSYGVGYNYLGSMYIPTSKTLQFHKYIE